MQTAIRKKIRDRAGGRCEYCLLPESGSFVAFHVEHIIPRQHGGTSADENLCLACPECNWAKGTNLVGIDPQSGQVAKLFHPRIQAWPDHFRMEGSLVIGITTEGRATASLMKMNSPERVQQRLHARP